MDKIVIVLIVALLIFASIKDIKSRTVSNKICILIAAISVIFGADFSGIIAALIVFFVTLKTGGIGGGDVKIFAALSLNLGLINGLIVLFFACFAELIFYALAKILLKKTVKTLPFVPFLSFGYFVLEIIK